MTEGDIIFTRLAMKYFGIKWVRFEVTNGTAKHPDIWCSPSERKIWANQEWARQTAPNRRSRITHEFLHFVGEEHNDDIGYSTYPDKDSYSRRIYNDIVRNSTAILAGQYGWRSR